MDFFELVFLLRAVGAPLLQILFINFFEVTVEFFAVKLVDGIACDPVKFVEFVQSGLHLIEVLEGEHVGTSGQADSIVNDFRPPSTLRYRDMSGVLSFRRFFTHIFDLK